MEFYHQNIYPVTTIKLDHYTWKLSYQRVKPPTRYVSWVVRPIRSPMLQVPVRLVSAMINACIAALAAVMTLGFRRREVHERRSID